MFFPVLKTQWFRIIFGTVCTLRFALAFGQGGWDRFAPDSLSAHLAEQLFGPARARLPITLYRPALIVRTAAALALASGLAPRLALLLVLAGAAMELLYLKSPNAVRRGAALADQEVPLSRSQIVGRLMRAFTKAAGAA